MFRIRVPDEVFDPYEEYEHLPTFISSRLHHGGIFSKGRSRKYLNEHWETLLDTYLKSPMSCKVLIEQLPDEETPAVPKKKSKRILYLEWHEESEVPKVGESSVEYVVDVEIAHVEIPSSQLDDFDPFFGINFDDGFEDQGSRVMEDQVGRGMEDQDGWGMDDQAGRGMEDQDGWGMDDQAEWGMDDQAVDDGMEDEADDGIVDEGNIIKDAVEVDVHMSSFNFSFVDPEDDVPVNLEDFESASDSDADLESLRRKKLRQVRRQKQKEQPTSVSFYVGQSFGSKADVKKLVKLHAVETRRNIVTVRNDKKRFRAVCRGKLPVFTGTSSDKGKEAMSSEQE
ncbi:hypothetical protein OSB04_021512, partial [Centaurea solstitialis]